MILLKKNSVFEISSFKIYTFFNEHTANQYEEATILGINGSDFNQHHSLK